MKKTRVLIVEDSPTVRLVLESIVTADPRLDLVGSVRSAEQMLEVLEETDPDVISLDIRLPGMNGLDATLEVMRRRPTPIVVVAADVNAEDGRLAMNALRAGALSVMEKPVGLGHAAYAAVASRLCEQLVLMSKVKVVRQIAWPARPTVRTDLPPPAGPAEPVARPDGFAVLAVVASTGGPAALVQLLTGLGAGFPLPVLAVQHIGPGFVAGFADWLRSQSPFAVRIAAGGEEPAPGTVHLPPPDRHLLLKGGRLELSGADPVAGQRPSGTELLRSVAAAAGRRGIGAVLTGMGSDGAEGLRELSRAGGYTIAEDAATAVVYGMPAAAVDLGAVKALLPLPAIAPHILTLLARTGRTGA
ncbi:chemotaxis protein CheB [Rhodocista pekingensis]|uniref:Protein-glutamate methylesterase/protein-glutamine glutaminase n=1 Tax=Rhodocista pekingensis TaxID=201185 RepID=A0ABW2KWR8_9PROT